jgi:hypothetical protein
MVVIAPSRPRGSGGMRGGGRGVRLAKLFVVVLARRGLFRRIGGLLGGLSLVRPLSESRVALHEVDSDAFPMGRNAVPGTDLRTTGQRFLAEATGLRRSHYPGYTTRRSRQGSP